MTERDRQRDANKEFRALGGIPSQRMKTAALGLWEGLSHSALLRSIVIVLKSHSALLRSIIIVLKVVAAKTNWWEKIRNTSLKLQVYCHSLSCVAQKT